MARSSDYTSFEKPFSALNVEKNSNILYIHDLEASLEPRTPMQFADDTSIYITGNSANDIQKENE
jgi:hypothetical protein